MASATSIPFSVAFDWGRLSGQGDRSRSCSGRHDRHVETGVMILAVV